MNWQILFFPFLLSVLFCPIMMWLTKYVQAFARLNARTVHQDGHISRIGGVAIYLSFIITVSYFVKADRSILAIVVAGSILFLTGLVDDLLNLKPLLKLALQALGATVLVLNGVGVDEIRLPGGIVLGQVWMAIVYTYVWVIGITNAMNLADGLDGLAGGMSVLMFVVIGSMSLVERRMDIAAFTFILASATLGFLLFNIHPASIFMGDCGSLFLGFMIAAVSLLGFRSSTIVTLALPTILLMLPIIDTFAAIVRRTIKRRRLMEADKSHLHHLLMKQFGHGRSVMIMWAITALFGMSAYTYVLNKSIGLVVMVVLFLIVELFMESSSMISEHFHPLLGLWHRLCHLFVRKKP